MEDNILKHLNPEMINKEEILTVAVNALTLAANIY